MWGDIEHWAPSYWLIPSEYGDFCWFGSQNTNLSSVYQKKNLQEWEDDGLYYLASIPDSLY